KKARSNHGRRLAYQLLMAQLLSRLTGTTIGALLLAAAMTLQPLDAAPAAGRPLPVPATNQSQTTNNLRQESGKDRAGKAKSEKRSESKKKWTKSERQELLKRAQVWTPTDIPSMDLRLGPQGREAFQPGQEVTCDYVYDEELPGTSRKFNCAISKND